MEKPENGNEYMWDKFVEYIEEYAEEVGIDLKKESTWLPFWWCWERSQIEAQWNDDPEP
ncbi:hypothetical protein LCGC14_1048110 [marine sediment metagenome]|uniref:Uncharacterized protein n=1 Tax=marine sediment metagenome TaxID=412755 RepID=A0A0F9MPP8_9ZZZZ